MRILLVNLTKMVNDVGGLAKVTCNFSNKMIQRGHDVSLICSDESSGNFYYHIDSNVQVYNAKRQAMGSKLIKMPRHLKVVREVLRYLGKRPARTVNSWFNKKYLSDNVKHYINEIQPDIIISFQPASSKLILSDLNIKIPVISMSHGDPEDYFRTYPKKEILALKKSAVNQVLMPGFERILQKHLPGIKTVTIGNAIEQYDFCSNLTIKKKQYKIVYVGALTKHRKRPHLLLHAFAEIADKYQDWVVELYGNARGKAYLGELEKIIKDNHLENRAFLKGTVNDIPKRLQNGDIFVFPSAAEGFGMAVAEAMNVGLPIIAYKSCPGVNELVRDGETGYLCEDGVEALVIALDKLVGDKNLRIKMGKAAKEDSRQYSPAIIWEKWEKLMQEIVKRDVHLEQ